MDISAIEEKFLTLIDKLPFDLALYHPLATHFAVAIPFLAFLFQWTSIINAEKNYQGTAITLFFFGSFFIFAAFFTGLAAAGDVKPSLSIQGQDLLDRHKLTGLYLVVAFAFLFTAKMFSGMTKTDVAKYFISFILFGALIALAYEVQSGHSLVFDYGAGVGMTYVE